MTTMIPPYVVDLSHYDVVRPNGFRLARMAGVVGVMHKATQGISMVDRMFAARRPLGRAAGLLWGSYHFGTGDDASQQAEWFLESANPRSDELVALDLEDNPRSQMTLEQAADWLHQVGQHLNRRPVLYSGNYLKEHFPKASRETQLFLSAHRLWLAEYGPPSIPSPWTGYFLHQFTGDGVGPRPHQVPGFATTGPGLDLNVPFSVSTLRQDWVS